MDKVVLQACSTRSVKGLIVVALFAVVLPLPSYADTWEDAQDAFIHYEDSKGLALLEQSAKEGDVRAMQAWGLALLHGQRLFPGLLQADPKQAAVWFDKVVAHRAAQGRSVPSN